MENLTEHMNEQNLKINDRSKKEKRRDSIIRVASELFSEKSYHDVTMEEIAEGVGVAKGTIYLYFDSKERLYLQILEDTFEDIESLLEREIEKSDPAPRKLKEILKIIFKFYRQHIDVLRILSRDETHLIREHYEFTEHWRLRRMKLYQKVLEKGVKEGSFRPINTKLTATIIFGLVRSVMFYYATDGVSEKDFAESQSWFLDMESESGRSTEEIAEDVFSVIAGGILASDRLEANPEEKTNKRAEPGG